MFTKCLSPDSPLVCIHNHVQDGVSHKASSSTSKHRHSTKVPANYFVNTKIEYIQNGSVNISQSLHFKSNTDQSSNVPGLPDM